MKRILIVDDEFGIGELLTDLLVDQGFRVKTAANGKQALAQIAEEKPDLVMLDFMMPIMNGAATLKALASDPATRDIPVVLMSSLHESMITTECNGYAAFLRKPFKIPAVLELVEQLTGKTD